MTPVKSFVSKQYKRVFADLQHFSDYLLALP